MSILNVLLSDRELVVCTDTLAEDALTGRHSSGAKLLLIPQYQLVLACRGSAQFFLRLYELSLQASFRAEFTMEQLTAEFGLVIDKLWPNYLMAARSAGLDTQGLGIEVVLGGWSPKNNRMLATAFAKDSSESATLVQPITGQLSSPGDPLRDWQPSMTTSSLLEAGRRQAIFLNSRMARTVAGGRLLAAIVRPGEASIKDLGNL